MLEDGIEPSLKDFQSLVLPLNYSSRVIRRTSSPCRINTLEPAGIEPTFIDCKSTVLPLNYGPGIASDAISQSLNVDFGNFGIKAHPTYKLKILLYFYRTDL